MEEIPQYLESHLDRLFRSAELINLDVCITREELQKSIYLLIKKNGFQTSAIRLLLTGGFSENDYYPGKHNLIITNKEAVFGETEHHKKGCALIMDEFQREMPEAKTINYIHSISLISQMNKYGAMDVLFSSENQIREGSRCNIFIVKNDIIYTPKEKILYGITRKQLMAKAISNGFKVFEKNIELEEFFSADEVFITSTSKRVMPVTQVGDHTFSGMVPGEITKKLMKLID